MSRTSGNRFSDKAMRNKTFQNASLSIKSGCVLGEMHSGHHEVDRLDAEERNDDAADSVDQKVEPQQSGGADWAIAHALQRQRNERDDDQRVEDDRGQDGALRRR